MAEVFPNRCGPGTIRNGKTTASAAQSGRGAVEEEARNGEEQVSFLAERLDAGSRDAPTRFDAIGLTRTRVEAEAETGSRPDADRTKIGWRSDLSARH